MVFPFHLVFATYFFFVCFLRVDSRHRFDSSFFRPRWFPRWLELFPSASRALPRRAAPFSLGGWWTLEHPSPRSLGCAPPLAFYNYSQYYTTAVTQVVNQTDDKTAQVELSAAAVHFLHYILLCTDCCTACCTAVVPSSEYRYPCYVCLERVRRALLYETRALGRSSPQPPS